MFNVHTYYGVILDYRVMPDNDILHKTVIPVLDMGIFYFRLPYHVSTGSTTKYDNDTKGSTR